MIEIRDLDICCWTPSSEGNDFEIVCHPWNFEWSYFWHSSNVCESEMSKRMKPFVVVAGGILWAMMSVINWCAPWAQRRFCTFLAFQLCNSSIHTETWMSLLISPWHFAYRFKKSVGTVYATIMNWQSEEKGEGASVKITKLECVWCQWATADLIDVSRECFLCLKPGWKYLQF